ncbi:hypothetical protein ASPZODRAFT_131718 [Penicilliopsis zonata CBS 506.65]|uniref:Zn(2)-C6 fungal-type domain-containing protein n=1 Tax=Penicilliopsis zonata CBS 506.65 TaxID=1073090 RepID=A0A1L9SI88_9EURO|nr:hypothetical protein ASPZODRAFT_131718 [Penicilliopsis zonata CBS 506.65]OJJ46826.1 hypothetical protein ASPZODRAFT_131718 [Penicilliopsis zonata CBS 506.65]
MPFDSPCDSCALRRVKCDRQFPCHPCLSRSQDCTYLRIRKRPGPKGPRLGTSLRIKEMQRKYLHERMPAAILGISATVSSSDAGQQYRIPLSAYLAQLDVFQTRLYNTWPIVSIDDLKVRLVQGSTDMTVNALAAAVCAAAMAQLRIFHAVSPGEASAVSVQDFARECLHFREQSDYLRKPSLDALLTSLFLHMFYANTGQIVAATLALREAIAYTHLLNLGALATLDLCGPEDRKLRLRVYWILFITERTFCIQHSLPMTLQRAEDTPEILMEDSQFPGQKGFSALIQLFSHIHNSLLPSHCLTMPDMSPTTYSRTHILDIHRQIRQSVPPFRSMPEAQSVDIVATSAWIRSLLWQYSAFHFMLSSSSTVETLAIDYPFTITKDFLESLSGISEDSIRAHGYGMEIKLLQISNAVLDIFSCAPHLIKFEAFRCGPQDAILSLEKLLLSVGGTGSEQLKLLRTRMSQTGLWSQSLRSLHFPDAIIGVQGDESHHHPLSNIEELDAECLVIGENMGSVS